MRTRSWAPPVLAVTGLVAMVVGCSSGPPTDRALEESSAAVSSGIEEGVEAIEDRDVVELTTRYNPCDCSAPEFEARLRGRWQRVVLTGPDDHLDELFDQARALDETTGLYFFRLEGQFVGPTRHPETGLEYEQFEVSDFDAVSYGELSR